MPRGLSCRQTNFLPDEYKIQSQGVEVSVETIAMFSWCSYFDMFMAVLS